MRSLSVRLLFSLFALITIPVMAHDVTITGTNTFAALDGSSSDHDGAANGVFTVNDGNLVVNGVVNCNDDGGSDSACAMAFSVSGNMTVGSGGALYAENRTGSGAGGAITLTVRGNLALTGTAIVSTASKSSSGSTGGAITAGVTGSVAVDSGATIDSGSANARGGAIAIAAGGKVTVDGNVLSGPSRTILATRLYGGAALDGGTSNSVGGAITIGSSSYSEPAVVIGATANIVSQGADSGAGPVTLDGCGITVRGLVAALSRKAGAAQVSIRSGKDVLIDGRDLGGTGIRMGRVRADAPTGTALNKGVDVFATETIDILGPSTGSLFVLTSLPGLHDAKSYGGLIRITSLTDAVNASGNAADDGHTASGDTGGTIEIAAKGNVNLNTAVLRAVGDFNTNNSNRGGGAIRVRSYSGNVIWTNGTGEVRPVGSNSNLPLADQGSIVLTACGSVSTTGSTFPVMGTATSVFPETHSGVCSPAAPSLPAGVPPLITCNTPPVANDTAASTNEDTTVTISLSGSDADGDALTFSIVSGPAHGTVGAVISTGPTTATVNYAPAANYNGADAFVFRADDGNGGTDDATVTIAIAAVNDAPSFLAGATVTVNEDSGPQSFPNWASGISAGPADESGQTVTFTVTAANPGLFSVPPAVSPNGTLTFTPAPNVAGTSSITLVAHDDGGTANGGDDTSNPQTSTITIAAVNDEPSFTAGGNVTVHEDSGAYSAAWASAISAGPGETQNVAFVATNDANALFSMQPAVSPSGVLTFTLAPNANGAANVSVFLKDDGGTANGGDDTSSTKTFVITITAVNDAPSFLAGPGVTALEDAGAQTYPNWASAISAGPGDESGQSVTFTVTNSDSSLFAVQPALSSNGTLTFTPAANASGSATISIVAHDDGGTANGGDHTSDPQTGTITITAVNDEPSFTGGGNVAVHEDSGAYSAPWASAISAGPGESAQSVTFTVTNSDNTLFAAQPAVSPAGVLTFTPAADANGFATVTVTLKDDGGTANGGDDTSAPQTFTITINAVNDAPSFTGGGDVTVLEDSGSYSAAWASAISAGPANESGQSVSFTVSNSNNGLFSAQPALDAGGNLTFTVAANAHGTSLVTVTLTDNGGTANGGVNTSGPQTFTIHVTAVNDAPSFTSGGNVTVNEDSGAYSAAWATAISAGPNESGQTVTFFASTAQGSLFSVQPSISASGVLTFTPAPNASGAATVTVHAQDSGGTANGGVNVSASVTFTITINGVNDGPTAGNDSWETVGNTELRVDRGAGATPHVADTTPSSRGVLDNDADNVEGDPVVVTGVAGCADTTAPFVCAVTGGTVTLEANGSFTFQPSPGATSGSFQYTATDQPSAGTPASATGSVTITIHDMIWYVNGSAPAGGNGTSASPFHSFASLDGSGDVDGAGHYLFVHASAVNGSIALEAQQKLWGEGVGLIIQRNLNGNGSPATLVAPGARPVVSSVIDTVTVTGVAGVEVAGLSLSSTSGNGIDVSSPAFAGSASASIYSNTITAGQEGIDVTSFNSGTTKVSIDGTDVVSNGNGVDVTGGTGTVVFSYNNGTISSATGSGIFADGAALDALYVTGLQGVTVTGGTAGNGVELRFARFDSNPGTATFDPVGAAVSVGSSVDPVGANAVVLSGVSGNLAFGTLTAHGAANGVTIAGAGLFTGSAGMQVTSGGGAITAAAGVGLSVTNASIGAAELKLTSLSAAGAANGILLNNTGTVGGLRIAGTGTAGSGGTIQNTTGTAVSATGSARLGLGWMNITNPAGHGVDAQNVSGSSSVVGTTITQFNAAAANGVQWINTNVNGTLTVSGTTISNAPTGNDGLFAEARGTSSMTVVVDQSSRFTGLFGDGVQVNTTTGASGNVSVTIRDSQFDTAAANGNNGIVLTPFGGPTSFDFLIERNTLSDVGRPVTTQGIINVVAGDLDGAGPSVTGTVQRNVIVRGNGRRAINMIADTFTTLFDVTVTDNDIDRLTKGAVAIDLRNNASGKARVTNNRIGQLAGFVGQVGFNEEVIRVQTQNNAVLQTLIDGNIVTANANLEVVRVRATGTSSHSTTVTNNTITDTAGAHLELAANTASPAGAGPALCFNVSGNTLPAAGVGVININEGAGTTLNVVQASAAAVSAGNSGATVTQAGTPQYGAAACALP